MNSCVQQQDTTLTTKRLLTLSDELLREKETILAYREEVLFGRQPSMELSIAFLRVCKRKVRDEGLSFRKLELIASLEREIKHMLLEE